MQLNTLHTCHRWAQAATCLTFLSVSPVLVLMLMPALISVLVLVLVLVVLVLMLSLLVCWDGACVYIATVSTLGWSRAIGPHCLPVTHQISDSSLTIPSGKKQ